MNIKSNSSTKPKLKLTQKEKDKKRLKKDEEGIIKVMHQEVLKKIENIKKGGKNNFDNTNSYIFNINKSTSLCFDNLEIEENEDEEKSIDIKIEEFETNMNSNIGNFVDFHPEKTRAILYKEKINENNKYISKYIVNSALNRLGKRKKTLPIFENFTRISRLNSYKINNNNNSNKKSIRFSSIENIIPIPEKKENFDIGFRSPKFSLNKEIEIYPKVENNNNNKDNNIDMDLR